MRFIYLPLVVTVVFSANLSGQDLSNTEIRAKIQELEKRVENLETLLEGKQSMAGIVDSNPVVLDRMVWRKLRVGMTDDQVRQLLGEPRRIERMGGGFYTWQYSEEPWHSTISFDKEGVSSWSEPD